MVVDQTGRMTARLELLRGRFDRWRQSHRRRSRLPDVLWAAAVALVGNCGLNRTARALGLNYYALKKQVEERHKLPSGFAAPVAAPELSVGSAFLELPVPAVADRAECMIEWENADGATMRIHLKGVLSPDLAALSRSFWDRGR